MRRIILIAALGLALVCTFDSSAPAQRFGGGHLGGGAGARVGGGGGGQQANISRPAMHQATPAFSRPSGGGAQQFQGGGSPGFAGTRPTNFSRPGAGGSGVQNSLVANRPSQAGVRPGAGGSGVQNPNLAGLAGQGGIRAGAGG